MMQNETKFRVLEKKGHMTQLCEKALLLYLVTEGSHHQVRPDGEDGWSEVTLICREYKVIRLIGGFLSNY